MKNLYYELARNVGGFKYGLFDIWLRADVRVEDGLWRNLSQRLREALR